MTHAVQDPAPNGDNGTTIDPLQYNCGNDAPSCGQVGESNGYYNGTNVDLLYSENYYCDANVSSAATSGCEVGAGPSPTPSATSAGNSGTSLGNTTHGDTLYIPVPLFSNPPPTQCTATATCIDHPPTIDLSRIAADLPGSPSMASVSNVPIPAHDHVVGTRNGGAPEWWNVEVVATTNPATFGTLTSVSAINAAVTAGTAITAPTNAFLFFQVLPGTLSASMAANLTATAPPGPAVPAAPAAPPASQVEPGTTFNNLMNDCGATAPNCQNVGISRDWIDGQDVEALYTEQYYCGTTSVAVHSSTGCEAGSDPTSVPPGVADTTPPTPTVTNSQIDPLYIPVPLYASPPVPYVQCSAANTCIDHPATIDLSQLASVLGAAGSLVGQCRAAGTRSSLDHPQRRSAGVVERHRHPGDLACGTRLGGERQELCGREGARECLGQWDRRRRHRRSAHQRLPVVPDAPRWEFAHTRARPRPTACPLFRLDPWSVVPLSTMAPATTRRTPRATWRPSVEPPATAP